MQTINAITIANKGSKGLTLMAAIGPRLLYSSFYISYISEDVQRPPDF